LRRQHAQQPAQSDDFCSIHSRLKTFVLRADTHNSLGFYQGKTTTGERLDGAGDPSNATNLTNQPDCQASLRQVFH
jgi:hypothetical protein